MLVSVYVGQSHCVAHCIPVLHTMCLSACVTHHMSVFTVSCTVCLSHLATHYYTVSPCCVQHSMLYSVLDMVLNCIKHGIKHGIKLY